MKRPLPPWTPMETAAWETVRALIPKPWPEELAIQDLRVDALCCAWGGGSMPSQRTYADRWGWTRHRACTLMQDEAAWAPLAQPNLSQDSAKTQPKLNQRKTVKRQQSDESQPSLNQDSATAQPKLSTRDLLRENREEIEIIEPPNAGAGEASREEPQVEARTLELIPAPAPAPQPARVQSPARAPAPAAAAGAAAPAPQGGASEGATPLPALPSIQTPPPGRRGPTAGHPAPGSAMASEAVMPPAPVVLADGRSLPGDLPGLLQGAMAGRLLLVSALLDAGCSDTRSVLEIPLERWRYVRGISAPTCAALQRALRERWGIELGCLAAGDAATSGGLPTGGLLPPTTPASTKAASIVMGALRQTAKPRLSPVIPDALKEPAHAK